jgi:hypothetical protein
MRPNTCPFALVIPRQLNLDMMLERTHEP